MKQSQEPQVQQRPRWDRLAPEGTLRRRVLRLGKWAATGCTGAGWDRAADTEPAKEAPADEVPADAPPAPLDLCDDEAVLQFLAEHFMPGASPQEAQTDLRGAARWVLGLLRRRPELRQRFPHALAAGVDGAYCRWLCREGAEEFELSSTAVEHIRDVFRAPPGDRVRQAFEFRPDLREAFPLPTIPSSRAAMFLWLICFGRAEQRFQVEESWWFLLECAELPARELARCYLLNPQWQHSFPLALTAFGQNAFLGWLGEHYDLGDLRESRLDFSEALRPADQLRLYYAHNDALQQLAPRAFDEPEETTRLIAAIETQQTDETRLDDAWWQRFAADDAQGLLERTGVNVLGHFCCPIGLQQAALATVRALQRVGMRTSCRNIPTDASIDTPHQADLLGLELFDTTLIYVQPEPFFDQCYERAALHPRDGVYRIGVWFWELETVPDRWAEHAQRVQELWAPTEFVARALRSALPVPVYRMLPGVELGPVADLPSDRFGLDPDRFTFLFLFDMCSVMQRKNPLGLIRAFRRAFRPDDRVAMVIKVSRGRAAAADFERLAQAASDAGVTLIDQVLSREKSYALIRACDCYVSLHRAEGFGLTLAEAMLMGKPVIATAYSGNMDFTTPENSLLVEYQRVRLREEIAPYPQGGIWADPSEEHAAHCMRWVYEHREQASALGARGRDDARRTLSLEAAGQRMARRLEELRGQPRAALQPATH